MIICRTDFLLHYWPLWILLYSWISIILTKVVQSLVTILDIQYSHPNGCIKNGHSQSKFHPVSKIITRFISIVKNCIFNSFVYHSSDIVLYSHIKNLLLFPVFCYLIGDILIRLYNKLFFFVKSALYSYIFLFKGDILIWL